MAETTPELNLFRLSLNPLQDYFSIDIGQVKGNGLEVERFSEKNRILDHLDDTHKIDILKQLIQCLRRLYQQSITCSQLSSFQIISLGNQHSAPDKSEKTNDIHSLANIYCSVLTNKKWQNYSEELPMEDIQCSDPDIAHDFLRVMTKDSTTNTKDVFLHPFYWSDVMKIDFICNAVDYINSEIPKRRKDNGTSILLQNLTMHEDVIPEYGWILCLELTMNEIRKIGTNKYVQNYVDKNVIFNLAQKSSANKNLIYGLMKFFRKHYVHRYGDVDRVKMAFGGYPAGYLRFFTSRFPNLIMHVYRNMKKIYLEGDTNLELYFLDDWSTPVKFPSGPVKEASPDVLPSINPGWKQIEGTEIEYDPASCYNEYSKVFNALRKSGAKPQEAVVKFVTNFNIEDKEIMQIYHKREIENQWDAHTHANVVTYFQSGVCKYEEKDAIFILMEKCDKKNLSERIKEGSLPYIKRAKTVKCIARGLQHLKERRILHRDLKPQNILCKGDIGVISDFGLSKKISPEKSHTYQSIPYLGTFGWGAPETYSDDAKNSFAADIYAAGLVFYFALTNGKHPYGDEPLRQAYINRDWNCNLKPLYETPDGKVAYDLISLMLSRDPKDRPTIEEVLEHPFFWGVNKKIQFYAKICSIIEYRTKKAINSSIFSSQNEVVEAEIKNWKDNLPLTDAEKTNIQYNFEKRDFDEITVQDRVFESFARQIPDSVTRMVRFIRNRFTHSGEDKGEDKIDLTDEQLWEFFNSRCPHLLIHTYHEIKTYYKTKPASDPDYFEDYFKKEDKNNTEL